MKFCEQCGTQWDDDIEFCEACGTPIYDSTSQVGSKIDNRLNSFGTKKSASNYSEPKSNPYKKINEILSSGDKQYPFLSAIRRIPQEESTIQLKIVIFIGFVEVFIIGIAGIAFLVFSPLGFLVITLALFEAWLLFGISRHENNKRLAYMSLLLINIIFSLYNTNNFSIFSIILILFIYWVLVIDRSTTRLFH